MQIGTLIKFCGTTEIGIVTNKAKPRKDKERWEVVGLINHIGFRYEVSFPNKHVEVLCK
jgi:hypothetical protein